MIGGSCALRERSEQRLERRQRNGAVSTLHLELGERGQRAQLPRAGALFHGELHRSLQDRLTLGDVAELPRHPPVQAQGLGQVDVLALRAHQLHRPHDLVPPSFEVAAGRHGLTEHGVDIRHPRPVTGASQGRQRAGDLVDALADAAGTQPGDPGDDLSHHLRHQRHPMLTPEANRLVGSCEQLVRFTAIVEGQRADRERKAQIERVVAAAGELVLLIADRARLIGVAEHPQRLTAV